MDADAQLPPTLQAADVVIACGDMDLDTTGSFADTLLVAVQTHPVVILDTGGVTFADSTFLNLLLRAHAATDLRVAATPHQLQRLLEMTGADTVLNLYRTVEEAARSPYVPPRAAG
ncbi:STAS domain-containing protein [Streptomyces sp. NPDC099050]|uniref:STAS domain-containing protein n=1 Tax=Streptomyces sp. NPDC099050 TaxID=3366100 RepID=UPI00380B1049